MKAELLAGALGGLAVALPAAAQQDEGDPAAGRELALELCTACHIVGPEQVGSDVAPPFPAIARDPEMTLTRLHAWIEPAHPVLPDLALTQEQIADVNAYLDSLRAPAAEPEAERPPSETEEPPPAIEHAPPEQLGPPVEVEPE